MSSSSNEAIAVVIEKLTEFIEGMHHTSAETSSLKSKTCKPEQKSTQVLLSFPFRLGDVSVDSPEELVSALRRWNDKVVLSTPKEDVKQCDKCACCQPYVVSGRCNRRSSCCVTYRCRGCGYSTTCRDVMLHHLSAVHRDNGTKYDTEQSSSISDHQHSTRKDSHYVSTDSMAYKDCNEDDENCDVTYVCEQCDYTSDDLHSLIAHFRSHDVPKPSSPLSYRCRLCGYTCRQQRTIKAHIWKHSGHQDIVYPMFRNGPLSIYEECHDMHAEADGSVAPVHLSPDEVHCLNGAATTEISIVNITGEQRKVVLRSAGRRTENIRNNCKITNDEDDTKKYLHNQGDICAERDMEKSSNIHSSTSVALCAHSESNASNALSYVTSVGTVVHTDSQNWHNSTVFTKDHADTVQPNQDASVISPATKLLNDSEKETTRDILQSSARTCVLDISHNLDEDAHLKTALQASVPTLFDSQRNESQPLKTATLKITELEPAIANTNSNSYSEHIKDELRDEESPSIHSMLPLSIADANQQGGMKRQADAAFGCVDKKLCLKNSESLEPQTCSDSGMAMANASRALEMATATLLALSPQNSLEVDKSASQKGGICRSLLAVIEQLCGEKTESDDESSASHSNASHLSYACRLCSDVFEHHRDLREHVRVHCEEAYRQVSASRPTDDNTPMQAAAALTAGSLACSQCDFVATSVRSLKSHGKRHANARRAVLRPLEVHACELCAYVCHHRASLKSHMWRHAADADYSYERTTRNIDAAGGEEHQTERVCDEQAPRTYTCHICGYVCRHASALKSHMWKHVSDENYSYDQMDPHAPRTSLMPTPVTAPECAGEVIVRTTN